MFVKAPIKSRPSGRLVHVLGEELGRQITHQGTKPVTQLGSGPTPCRGPNQYACHTLEQINQPVQDNCAIAGLDAALDEVWRKREATRVVDHCGEETQIRLGGCCLGKR